MASPQRRGALFLHYEVGSLLVQATMLLARLTNNSAVHVFADIKDDTTLYEPRKSLLGP